MNRLIIIVIIIHSDMNKCRLHLQNLTPLDLAAERRNAWIANQIRSNIVRRGNERSNAFYASLSKPVRQQV